MKKQSWWITGLVGMAVFGSVNLGWAAELKEQPEPLQKFVVEPNHAHAGISFHGVDLDTGKTAGAYNENMSIVPASTMKIVTSAAALELLGKDYQFETRLLYDGTINKNGVLKGNLFIQGMGDPTLGSDGVKVDKNAFLKQWLEAMRKAEIKKVDGNIIVLDGLFGYQGVPGKWLWEDFGTDYGAGTYGISVYDNLYTLYLKSGSVGTLPVILRTEPTVTGLKIKNQSKVAGKEETEPYVRGIPFSFDRILHGDVLPNQEEYKMKSDIPDPGLFLAQHFLSYLTENGIQVQGKATTERLTTERPKAEKTLVITKSVTLSEIVKVLMSRSDNHYAEHLYEFVKTEKKTTIADFWKEKGFPVKALVMRDGSGMSPQNALSAKFLTDLLVYMDRPEQANLHYKELFPIAGQEGTVKLFLKGSPLEGKAFIKTGSFSGVQSYAGYVENNGKRYAFAIIVNNWNGTRNELRVKIAHLLVDLFASASSLEVKKAA